MDSPATSTLSIISQKTLAVPQLQTGKCGSAAQIWRAVAIASRLRTFRHARVPDAGICDKIGSIHRRRRCDENAGALIRAHTRPYALGCALGFFAPLVAFALVGIEQLLP